MPIPIDFYAARINAHTHNIRRTKNTLRIVSFFRLAAFIVLCFFGYQYINTYAGSILPPLISLIIFSGLVRATIVLSASKKLLEKKLFINENEARIVAGGLNAFPNGSDLKLECIYCEDLDITGERSLYHLLNRTTTNYGARALSALLIQNNPIEKIISASQAAIQQLSPQQDVLQLVAARGLLNSEKETDMADLAAWMETPQRLAGRWPLTVVRWTLPIINILLLLYYLDSDNPLPLGAGILLSWLFTGYYFKYITHQHALTSKKQSALEQYGAILQTFSQVQTGNSILLTQLTTTAGLAHRQLIRLSKLTGLFDQRLNLLVGTLLNSFFLYDLQCIAALEKWKGHNRTQFRKWLTCVGDIEATCSLAVFAFNNPGYCYPTILSSDKPMIATRKMAHPLMPGKLPVPNDITAGRDEKLLLITGSNMSGKSTFLRTIGINLILAQAGAPVFAGSFAFTPMQILSSIRISDSLQENTSYFMAELKRLQQIIMILKTGRPALTLIDEVLRGTNSDDKSHGSEAFIKKLLTYASLSFFATHDLSLSEAEHSLPGQVSNYCFESAIVNGELLFDYTLQRGIAKNKNASFLMEKMDII